MATSGSDHSLRNHAHRQTLTPLQLVGLLGGTFDPIHCGHLRLAIEMKEQLGLSRVVLIPAHIPPHRDTPQVDAPTRHTLLQAAVEAIPGLEVDDRELQREKASYTIDTLRSLNTEHPGQSYCLLLGMDAFRGLDNWYQWQDILRYCHLGIAQRPGANCPQRGPVAKLLEHSRVTEPKGLTTVPAGRIIIREIPALDISATAIRQNIAKKRNISFLVPPQVQQIIRRKRLYQDAK